MLILVFGTFKILTNSVRLSRRKLLPRKHLPRQLPRRKLSPLPPSLPPPLVPPQPAPAGRESGPGRLLLSLGRRRITNLRRRYRYISSSKFLRFISYIHFLGYVSRQISNIHPFPGHANRASSRSSLPPSLLSRRRRPRPRR
jgi:hypothetical protein